MSDAEPLAPLIYSLGHSNQPVEELIARLLAHDLRVVVDCRSAPYSAYSTWFNREELMPALSAAGIQYLYFGEELGGRPEGNAPADYEQMAQRPAFRSGLARVQELGQAQPVCLLCSEEDPRRCHRSKLIAHELLRDGVDVQHLRRDGKVEMQSELEQEAAQQLRLF